MTKTNVLANKLNVKELLKEFANNLNKVEENVANYKSLQKDYANIVSFNINSTYDLAKKIPASLELFQNQEKTAKELSAELLKDAKVINEKVNHANEILNKRKDLVNKSFSLCDKPINTIDRLMKFYKEGNLKVSKDEARNLDNLNNLFKQKLKDVSKMHNRNNFESNLNSNLEIPKQINYFVKPSFIKDHEEDVYFPNYFKDYLTAKQKTNVKVFDDTTQQLQKGFEQKTMKVLKKQEVDEKFYQDFKDYKNSYILFSNGINKRLDETSGLLKDNSNLHSFYEREFKEKIYFSTKPATMWKPNDYVSNLPFEKDYVENMSGLINELKHLKNKTTDLYNRQTFDIHSVKKNFSDVTDHINKNLRYDFHYGKQVKEARKEYNELSLS